MLQFFWGGKSHQPIAESRNKPDESWVSHAASSLDCRSVSWKQKEPHFQVAFIQAEPNQGGKLPTSRVRCAMTTLARGHPIKLLAETVKAVLSWNPEDTIFNKRLSAVKAANGPLLE